MVLTGDTATPEMRGIIKHYVEELEGDDGLPADYADRLDGRRLPRQTLRREDGSTYAIRMENEKDELLGVYDGEVAVNDNWLTGPDAEYDPDAIIAGRENDGLLGTLRASYISDGGVAGHETYGGTPAGRSVSRAQLFIDLGDDEIAVYNIGKNPVTVDELDADNPA